MTVDFEHGTIRNVRRIDGGYNISYSPERTGGTVNFVIGDEEIKKEHEKLITSSAGRHIWVTVENGMPVNVRIEAPERSNRGLPSRTTLVPVLDRQ